MIDTNKSDIQLILCVKTIGANYFGIGTSKETAFKDLCRKWRIEGVSFYISEIDDCLYFEINKLA